MRKAETQSGSSLHPLVRRVCESCGFDVQERRRRCWHCGDMVCGYCWHHEHRCEPGHSKAKCRDHKRYRRHGAEWIARLRARKAMNPNYGHTPNMR